MDSAWTQSKSCRNCKNWLQENIRRSSSDAQVASDLQLYSVCCAACDTGTSNHNWHEHKNPRTQERLKVAKRFQYRSPSNQRRTRTEWKTQPKGSFKKDGQRKQLRCTLVPKHQGYSWQLMLPVLTYKLNIRRQTVQLEHRTATEQKAKIIARECKEKDKQKFSKKSSSKHKRLSQQLQIPHLNYN